MREFSTESYFSDRTDRAGEAKLNAWTVDPAKVSPALALVAALEEASRLELMSKLRGLLINTRPATPTHSSRAATRFLATTA